MRRLERLPPLQCLRAFLAVAETGSFTRAAEGLGLTQTAVSHQIAQLEAHVGCALLVRGRPGVTLTVAGRRLLPPVEAGLRTLQDGIAAATPTRRGAEIALSTTPEFGTQWLAPRLEQLFREDPGLRVRVTLEYRRADLLAGEADIAIWLGPGGKGLKATRLGLEEEFVVCSRELDARLPQRNGLKAAPLLRYAGARHTVLDWERWFMQINGRADARTLAFADLELGAEHRTFADMIEACKKGEGLALVRTSLVEDELSAGQLVRCFTEVVASDLQHHVVVPAGTKLRADVERFQAWLIGASTASRAVCSG